MPLEFPFMNKEKGEETETNKPAGEALPVSTTFDLTAAKNRFEGHIKKIDALVNQVKGFNVENDDDAKILTGLLGKTATLKADIEEERKKVIKEPDTFVRGFNSFVKGFRDKVESVISIGKKKISDHSWKKEVARRAEEEKLKEAVRKQQEELNRLAEKEKVTAPVIPQMVSPVKTTPIKTETGSAQVRYVWTGVLEDIKKVPREYLMFNQKAVDNAIQAGIREIPGVKIFEKPDTRIIKG